MYFKKSCWICSAVPIGGRLADQKEVLQTRLELSSLHHSKVHCPTFSTTTIIYIDRKPSFTRPYSPQQEPRDPCRYGVHGTHNPQGK